MDMLKRDRFELLSAYLDGEVTAAERQQVEAGWEMIQKSIICATVEATPKLASAASATKNNRWNGRWNRCLTLEPPTASGCGLGWCDRRSVHWRFIKRSSIYTPQRSSTHRRLRQSNH